MIALLLLVSTDGYSSPKEESAFGISVPSYKIHGIDVSGYQEKINWKEISGLKSGKKKIGITFAFVKATEGQTFKDKYFDHNWRETKKHKIIRGAYHYYKPNVNSKLQAANFIRCVKLEKGDMPPVLDIEEVGKYGSSNMKRGVINYLKLLEKHYGIKPIIYTNIHFYRTYLSGYEFKKYDFWIANYSKIIPKTGKNWLFWQYSDKGIIRNIRSKVAFNVYFGTKENLLRICKK
jgi:lysozyme